MRIERLESMKQSVSTCSCLTAPRPPCVRRGQANSTDLRSFKDSERNMDCILILLGFFVATSYTFPLNMRFSCISSENILGVEFSCRTDSERVVESEAFLSGFVGLQREEVKYSILTRLPHYKSSRSYRISTCFKMLISQIWEISKSVLFVKMCWLLWCFCFQYSIYKWYSLI